MTSGNGMNVDRGSRAETDADAGMADARTPENVRRAVQELLRTGAVESTSRPDAYRILLADATAVRAILEPLDMEMGVDEVRGLVFVRIARSYTSDSGDEWTHPLVRRDRLTLEQSLMVAILRRRFIAHETEAGIGAERASVDLDDLVPELNQFMGGTGSESQDDHRVQNLLEQLRRHGIVDEVDANHQVRVSPLIAHLANPESLDQLLSALRETAGSREDAS